MVSAVRNNTMEARWSAPSGWPIVDEGLLMVGIDDVMIIRVDVSMTDAGFTRHLEEMARAIDERAHGLKIGVLYDCLGGVDSDAGRRQRTADMLASRRAKLAATTAAFSLVTDSALTRGAMRAVFWMAPPPYPWSVSSTLREGFECLRTEMPGLDVDRVLREYDRLKVSAPGPASSVRGHDDGKVLRAS
jgi:hypothetical protein